MFCTICSGVGAPCQTMLKRAQTSPLGEVRAQLKTELSSNSYYSCCKWRRSQARIMAQCSKDALLMLTKSNRQF